MRFLKGTVTLICTITLLMLVSGCSVTQIKAPVSTAITDRVQLIDISNIKIELLELPDTSSKPKVAHTKDGEKVAGFNKKQLRSLKELREVAKVNTDIAIELIATNKALIDNRNTIVELAKIEESRANFMAEKWAAAETALEKEKRDHIIDVWSQRILMLLGIIATAL